MDIDLAAAARFLAALSPDTRHTFQTFDDAKHGRRGMTRVLHGTFARHADTLAGLNRKGAGVFVMVNRGDGMGRKADNVIGCRALFVDLDGSPLAPVLAAPIPPRIVVESSPGKWHGYWPVTDLPPDQFTSAQKTLAAQFAGDPKVHDRPRVMRVPGFLHRKGEQPFLSRLVTCDAAPLTWAEMVEAFGLSQRMTLPNVIPEGERNSTLFALARSAAAKGIPLTEQVKRALQVNAKRCATPLSEAEVVATVGNAYNGGQAGTVALPLAVLDSPAFKAAGNGARLLLVLAYRKLDGFNNGRIPLVWSELRDWFPRENTFDDIRTRLTESGLVEVAVPAVKPGKGCRPRAALYRLAIPPKSAPYRKKLIPPKSGGLEALQAVAVEALEGALEACGKNGGPK